MNFANTEIVKAFVHPMCKWANNPQLYITLDRPFPRNRGQYTYQWKEGLWWTQHENGYTHFLSAPNRLEEAKFEWEHPLLKLDLPHYQTTTKSQGFGGTTWLIRAITEHGEAVVGLRGPWSSGCYYANNVLPEPAIEVTINTSLGGYLPVRMANELLKDTNWEVVMPSSWRLKDYPKAPELTYKGMYKEDIEEGSDIWNELEEIEATYNRNR